MKLVVLALSALIASTGYGTADEVLDGTWKLVSSKRTNTATGATVDTLGPAPQGFIMYGRDGRMMVIEARGDRPKPADLAKMTDQQRSQLFSSMLAYAGTYKFDGKTIEHHIDLSWNQAWTGTAQAREVKKEGDRLIYTTRPAPSPIDGSMGFATLVWEKVK
jgi:hypothetical protein